MANARGVYGAVGPGGYCGTSGDHGGSGNYGLLGTEGEGVRGVAGTGIGMWGSSDSNVGVYGTSNSSNGVSGGSGSASGVYGISSTGYGVFGTSPTNSGVRGESNSDIGVSGSSVSYIGVEGTSDSSYGVFGYSSVGIGVRGQSGNAVEVSPGVWGEGTVGVKATGTGPYGIGIIAEGMANAGIFDGDVVVNGELHTPVLKVMLDHPLDPENKYLSHSSVQSSEMKNIYDGTAITDAQGYATVTLPDYFEALNKDFRYQLTVLDDSDSDSFVQAKVVQKIEGNRFTIRTSKPGVEVSWQVTGMRNDAWAKAHPVKVEEDKPEKEKGIYLAPEVFGQPKEKGTHHRLAEAHK